MKRLKDMVCPRCSAILKVERVNGIIEITCMQCKYTSDVSGNVRDAQEEFFSTVGLMDSMDRLREAMEKLLKK